MKIRSTDLSGEWCYNTNLVSICQISISPFLKKISNISSCSILTWRVSQSGVKRSLACIFSKLSLRRSASSCKSRMNLKRMSYNLEFGQGKKPFEVTVQIFGCHDQNDHHQEAPKHKEEWEYGLADPEDLEKLNHCYVVDCIDSPGTLQSEGWLICKGW